MNKIDLVKKAVSLIVGFGTTKIVHGIIQNNVAVDTVPQRVAVASSSAVIGMMAGDATSAYTDAKIDEVVIWWDKNVTNRSK